MNKYKQIAISNINTFTKGSFKTFLNSDPVVWPDEIIIKDEYLGHKQFTRLVKKLKITNKNITFKFPGSTLGPNGLKNLLQLKKSGKINLDLSNVTLTGDFSTLDFSELNLSNARLNFAIFKNAKLTGANLIQANLTRANLTQANLTQANLLQADLTQATLTNTNLTEDGSPREIIIKDEDLNRQKFTKIFKKLKSIDNITYKFPGSTLGPDGLKILLQLKKSGKINFDLSNVTLTGDFSNLDFSELNLSNARLNFAIFKNANLTGANLTGANLLQANLTRANLLQANLTRANLLQANLLQANLTRANLTRANLTQANLFEANLTGANLTQANLTQADLLHATLTKADLFRATLTETNLSQADLTEATLTNTNLTKADLFRATLTKANLAGATLTETNLSQADLTQADLFHATLTKANLAGATLSKANLTIANLSEATLAETQLKDANLHAANLTRANLTQANLTGSILRNANLNQVTIDDETSMSELDILGTDFSDIKADDIGLDKWSLNFSNITPGSQGELNRYFNHITNQETGSILTAIQTIPIAFDDLKAYLMKQVITFLESLEGGLLQTITSPLLDIFQHYEHVHEVKEFCKNRLVPLKIEEMKTNLQPNIPAELPLLCEFMNQEIDTIKKSKDTSKEKDFLATYGLVVNCLIGSSPEVKQNYLHDLEGLETQWNDLVKTQISIEGITDDDDQLPEYHYFLSPNKDHVLMMDKDTFGRLLDPNSEETLDTIIIYNRSADGRWSAIENVTTVLKTTFPTIQSKIEEREKRGIYDAFLEGILPSEPREILDTFQDATHVSSRTTPFGLATRDTQIHDALTDWMKEMFDTTQLNNVVGTTGKTDTDETNAHIQGLFLKGETVATIEQVFSTTLSTPATSEEKAVLYLSLAFNFIYSNSSKLFGSEDDSPLPLRIMGLALLNKAFSEINSLEISHPLKYLDESRRDWSNKLMGVNRAFTCSAMISEEIFRQLDDVLRRDEMTHLKDILNIVIPDPWTR